MAEDFEIDLLKQTVAQLFGEHPDDLQDQVEQMGLLDLLIPEDAGGIGGTLAEALAVHGEIGRGLARVPYLQCTAAGVFLSELGIERPTTWTSLLLDPVDLSWTLDPRQALLPFADQVDSVLVCIDGTLGVVAAEALSPSLIETVDPTFPLSRISVTDPGTPLGTIDPAALTRALDTATRVARSALVAELVGSVEKCLDDVFAHLEAREQFGRPIGTFQAVQHKAADMAIRLEGMRGYLHALGQHGDPRITTMAKAYASDGARFIAETSLQLYGGMGFTFEHPVHRHLRHAHRCGQLLGAPSALRACHLETLA